MSLDKDVEKMMKAGMVVGQHLATCPECARTITKHMEERGEMAI